MSELPDPSPRTQAAHTVGERLNLANRLYREFYAQCFWHCPPDLVITEELLPLVVKGLRTYGGRRGFLLAEELQPKKVTEAGSGHKN